MNTWVAILLGVLIGFAAHVISEPPPISSGIVSVPSPCE